MRDDDGQLLCPESLMADVRALNDAMAGCGTNDDAVIRTMLNRTPAQLKAINDLFFKTYGKDLVETLKSDLTGDVEDAMVLLAEVTSTCRSRRQCHPF